MIWIISLSGECGGAGISTKRLFDHLISQGLDCQLITASKTYSRYGFTHHNIRLFFSRVIHKIDSSILKLFPYRKKLPWNIGLLTMPLFFFRSSINRADTVICTWQPGMIALNSLNKIGAKVIVIMHDAWWITAGCHTPIKCGNIFNYCKECPQLQPSFITEFIGPLLRKRKINDLLSVYRIICPSQFLTDLVCHAHPGLFEKTSFFPNYFDLNVFKYRPYMPADRPTLTLVGGHNLIDPAKGLYDLEATFNNISLGCKDYNIVVLGGGVSGEYEGVRIVNLPYISDPLILAHYYCMSTVVMHLSRFENASNLICEASLCGAPVICWNIGGNAELVDIDNVFQVGDIVGLSARINKIFIDSLNLSAFNYYRKNIARRAKEKNSAIFPIELII